MPESLEINPYPNIFPSRYLYLKIFCNVLDEKLSAYCERKLLSGSRFNNNRRNNKYEKIRIIVFGSILITL